MAEIEWIKCPDCEGNDNKCKTCEGTGEVGDLII